MFDQFPVEIVLHILALAAQYDSAESHSNSVTIALVSKEVYRIVRPTLYRTMEVRTANAGRLQHEDVQVLQERVLPQVKYLFLPKRIPESLAVEKAMQSILKVWNPAPDAHLDVSWPLVQYFAIKRPDAFRKLRRLDLSFVALRRATSILYVPYQHKFLTHVVGFLPTHGEEDASDTNSIREWAMGIALCLPAVTHLGLKLAQTPSNPPMKFDARYVDIVKAALTVFCDTMRPLERVVLRITGRYEEDDEAKQAFIQMVQAHEDERVTVWFDARGSVKFLPSEDIWAGYDFWSRNGEREIWTSGKNAMNNIGKPT